MLIAAMWFGSGSSYGVFEQAAKVKTPIGLAALSLMVLFLIYHQIIAKSTGLSSTGTERMVRFVFILAVIVVILGFGAYIIHSIFASDSSVHMYGRVVTAQNSTIGVSGAIVHVQVDTIMDVPALGEGDFALVFPRSYIGRNAKIWSTAPDYQTSAVQQIIISPLISSISIPLVHMAITGEIISDVNCLLGAWLEKPGEQFVWQIYQVGDSLRLRRGDGWAIGDFHKEGPVWTGSLHWGNGTFSPDMSLSPNKACNHLDTNKDWWYERKK